ncbi:fluoride efflux transporter CrcB [Schleiferia thermophila]|jgi:CrcB protein|uniref:fluoride efflux transporter CrcB n=1 Tax=Schleiferia thermophila TaxID=884107 RepID=UPI00068A0390|nr:fluoride efflux transporter CrcB [Schleiferia thermophila]
MEIVKYTIIAGIGSFIGGTARYLISVLVQQLYKIGYPVSTLFVNVFGSFFIGIVLAFWQRDIVSDSWRIFLATGILGGFTTFSSFSQEVMLMMRSGEFYSAFSYIGVSVLLGILACSLGFLMAK